MSDQLKSFQEVATEALIEHFTKADPDRSDVKFERTVVDRTTGNYVRTYGDEHLSSFSPSYIEVQEAREADGIVYVTFRVLKDKREYTFEFTDRTTLMNIVMKAALAA